MKNLNKIVLKSFLEEYTLCFAELNEYFNKNPINILNHQEFRSFLPNIESINKKNSANYTFDLILLCLFLDRDLTPT